jgi:PleD family two-component response regulator
VAKLLRGKEKSKDIQIIFITAISKEQEYVHKGYEVGAVSYLFKPIEPDVLKNKVNVALQWSRYEKKVRAAEKKE